MTDDEVPKSVSQYMKRIGAKGGAAGRGAKKKRSGAHYKKMVEARKKNKVAKK